MIARQIAIDGPAGAGKSTVARLVADRLGYLYIDTGAMYRALAWLAIKRGLAYDDEQALVRLAQETRIELINADGDHRVYCGGEDITLAIREAKVGNAASPISAIAGVREALVAEQQRLGKEGCVVMDGRDIGTKVLPQAKCKIFLTASLEERSRRRTLELQTKGLIIDVAEVSRDIKERDRRDSSRVASPLMQADDAVLLDSSNLNIEQVVQKILQLAGA
ncbi:MAG: (d)CMP kinase [Clostridiales bacterium]|nr:(d)CMP kinase [Clostridiales bacterium]